MVAVNGIYIIIQVKIRHMNDFNLLLIHFLFNCYVGKECNPMPCHYRTFYGFRGIQLEHDFKFLYGISLLVQILDKHAVGTELFVKHDHGNPFQLIYGDLVWYMEPIAGNQTYFIAEGRAAYKFVRLYISHNESQICLPTFNPMDYLFGRNGIKAEG